MCLLLLSLNSHPEYKLILAANRDEYYERPTKPATFWDEAPHLVAGKDLRGGGTWLGMTRQGRIAAVTNYRDPASDIKHAPSRGKLLTDYLLGQDNPSDFLDKLDQKAIKYNGFNLVVGDKDRLYWYSNRGGDRRPLMPGIYGISNHLIDTPWPKLVSAKESMIQIISKGNGFSSENLFKMLYDSTLVEDSRLPNTGVGLEWERILSPIFIKSPTYGTRSSTLILVDKDDHVSFLERTYNAHPENTFTVNYEFVIDS